MIANDTTISNAPSARRTTKGKLRFSPWVLECDFALVTEGLAAFHEAGHAVVGLILGAGELVSAILASTLAPNVAELQDGSGVFFKGESHAGTRADAVARRHRGHPRGRGGHAGRPLGGWGRCARVDLHSATLSALTFEASYGLGRGFAYLASEDEGDLFAALRLDRYLHARVDKVLADQFARAKKIVEGQRQEVERIAEAVLAVGVGGQGSGRPTAPAQAGRRA